MYYFKHEDPEPHLFLAVSLLQDMNLDVEKYQSGFAQEGHVSTLKPGVSVKRPATLRQEHHL